MAEPRMSAPTLKVLGTVLTDPRGDVSGSDIARMTGLASGTLYPILLRLEQAGWLASHWEKGNPRQLGRPRRRYYRVTALGAKRAKAAFGEFTPILGRFAWA